MQKQTKRRLTILLALGGALFGFLFTAVWFPAPKLESASGYLPHITLPPLLHDHPALTYNEMKLPAVIHFFASWCSLCKGDHELLKELAGEYNLYGIVIADQRSKATAWLQNQGNPYLNIGLDEKGDAPRLFALNGVPETVLINKDKEVFARVRGAMTKDNIAEIRKALQTQ